MRCIDEDSHGHGASGEMGGDRRYDGQGDLDEPCRHQVCTRGRTTKHPVKVAEHGAKQEREERDERRLVQLVETESPVRVRGEYSGDGQTELGDIPAEVRVSMCVGTLTERWTCVWKPHHM